MSPHVPDLPCVDLPAVLDHAGLEAASRLAYRVAHCLGNATTVLCGNARRLRREIVDLEFDSQAKRCLRNMDEGLACLSELDFAFSRFLGLPDDAGAGCCLAEELTGRRWTEFLAGCPPPLAVEPEVCVDAGAESLPPVRVAPERLRAALAALLRNADEAQADTADPRIRVMLSRVTLSGEELARMLNWGARPGQYGRLAVEDGGEGIPGGVLPNIFTPAYSTRMRHEGFGLSLVYGLVKSMGGDAALGLCTEPGRGTRVSLYFHTQF